MIADFLIPSWLTRWRIGATPRNSIEQSLTELLALSAHDAWSSLVSRRLPRPRRPDRRRRLQPLPDRRARAVAARGGTSLSEFRRRARSRPTRVRISAINGAGRLRHRLSAARLGSATARRSATTTSRCVPPGAIPNARDAAGLAGSDAAYRQQGMAPAIAALSIQSSTLPPLRAAPQSYAPPSYPTAQSGQPQSAAQIGQPLSLRPPGVAASRKTTKTSAFRAARRILITAAPQRSYGTAVRPPP